MSGEVLKTWQVGRQMTRIPLFPHCFQVLSRIAMELALNVTAMSVESVEEIKEEILMEVF